MISPNRSRRSIAPLALVLIVSTPAFGQSYPPELPLDVNALEYAKALVTQYEELEQRMTATIEAAEIADPNLREFKTAREKMKRWYEDDLRPAKRRWVQWRAEQPDPTEAEAIFRNLKSLAGIVFFAHDLDDPNLGPFIRYTALPILIQGAKDPNGLVGPYTRADEEWRQALEQNRRRQSQKR